MTGMQLGSCRLNNCLLFISIMILECQKLCKSPLTKSSRLLESYLNLNRWTRKNFCFQLSCVLQFSVVINFNKKLPMIRVVNCGWSLRREFIAGSAPVPCKNSLCSGRGPNGGQNLVSLLKPQLEHCILVFPLLS